jgi:hypothetical protein
MFDRSLGLALICLAFAASPGLAQGKLENLRQAVRSPAPTKEVHPSDDESETSLFDVLFGAIELSFDSREEPSAEPPIPPPYLRYPYQRNFAGYYMEPPSPYASEADKEEYERLGAYRRAWSMRMEMDDMNSMSGINRMGGRMQMEHASRWGMASSVHWFNERTPAGTRDDVGWTDVTMTYALLQAPAFQFRVGAGWNMLYDSRRSDHGAHGMAELEILPQKRWILTGLAEGGTIGTANYFHGRTTAGWCWRGMEWYVGYDYWSIANTPIQGPVVGMRMWF